MGKLDDVRIQPFGRHSAIAGSEVRIINLETGITKLILEIYAGDVVFAPDGQTILSYGCTESDNFRCVRGDIGLWDVQTGEPLHVFEVPGRVTSLASAPDAQTIVVGINSIGAPA